MKIISIINQKGGVGKTTSTIHLGSALARKGYKVLMIDFDSQRNLSIGYKVDEEYAYTVLNFLESKEIRFVKRGIEEELHLLAGSENLVAKGLKRTIILDQLKKYGIIDKVDFILIDCQPTPLNPIELNLGEIAVSSSDYVLIPLRDEEYSTQGLAKFIKGILRVKKEHNPKLEILGWFFNDKDIRESWEWKSKIEEANYFKEFLFKTFIRRDIKIRKAQGLGKTIFEVAPNSRASEDYNKLVEEILDRIENK